MERLTARTLKAAAVELGETDPVLGASLERNGPPPLWARDPSFPTLVHLILEQQVSLASAKAAFDRLAVALGVIEPSTFLELSDEQLKTIGFSRQKAGYARALATELQNGFTLQALARLPDDEVRTALTAHRGIGPWTADIYLTMCLLRPDVWPTGDRALATAAHDLFELDRLPLEVDLAAMAERWRPLRAVAARMLWFDYLIRRGLGP